MIPYMIDKICSRSLFLLSAYNKTRSSSLSNTIPYETPKMPIDELSSINGMRQE